MACAAADADCQPSSLSSAHACRLTDPDNLRSLLDSQSSIAQRDCQQFEARLGVHGAFRPANPTAHYELDLVLPHHRHAAMRLADLAAEEGTP